MLKAKKEKIPTEKPSKPVIRTPYDLLANMDRFYKEDPWMTSFWNWPYLSWPERWNEFDKKISPLDLVDTGDKYRIIINDFVGYNK